MVYGKVLCILKDESYKTVGARVEIKTKEGKKVKDYATQDLKLHKDEISLSNAIITKDGFVRSNIVGKELGVDIKKVAVSQRLTDDKKMYKK